MCVMPMLLRAALSKAVFLGIVMRIIINYPQNYPYPHYEAGRSWAILLKDASMHFVDVNYNASDRSTINVRVQVGLLTHLRCRYRAKLR